MSTANQNFANPGAQRHEQALRDKVSSVADQAQHAAEDIKKTAQKQGAEMLNSAREIGNEAKQAAQERFDQVRDVATEYMHEGRDRAVELERTIEHQIRSQPVRSVLVAAGIGFVLGLVFIRR